MISAIGRAQETGTAAQRPISSHRSPAPQLLPNLLIGAAVLQEWQTG